MIARYSRDTMASVWTEEAKFSRWFRVELAVAAVQVREKILPRKEGRELRRSGERVLLSDFRAKKA